MKPLLTANWTLTWLCLLPAGESFSKWQEIIRTAIPWILSFCSLCSVCEFLAFILENITTDFKDCLLTFGLFISYSILICTIIIAFYSRRRVPSIFELLTAIHDASKLMNKMATQWNPSLRERVSIFIYVVIPFLCPFNATKLSRIYLIIY